MAILFFGDSEEGVIKIVSSIHYQPELLDQETRDRGIEVDNNSIPKMQQISGKDIVLKYDTQNKVFLLDYVDRPFTSEEKIQQLESDLGNVLLESAADKAKIAELEIAQGNLLMEIALLKGGNV